MIGPDNYRFFVRVAASASFAEAARQMSVSPAAVTRRIAALEQSLGVRLLSRTTRSVRLTADGELFLLRAGDIVRAMEEAEEELRARTSNLSGSLSVTAPLSFGRRHIAPIVADFARVYPDVSVKLTLSDISDDLSLGEFDLALRVGAPERGEYVTRRVLSARRVVCASPDYVARYGRPATPADLAVHRCLAVLRDGRPIDRWMFITNGVAETVQVPISLSSNSGEVVQAWAESGAGIALKSRWDVSDQLSDGRLVELLADASCEQADIFAVYRDRRNLPLRTRSFLNFLTEALASTNRLPSF